MLSGCGKDPGSPQKPSKSSGPTIPAMTQPEPASKRDARESEVPFRIDGLEGAIMVSTPAKRPSSKTIQNPEDVRGSIRYIDKKSKQVMASIGAGMPAPGGRIPPGYERRQILGYQALVPTAAVLKQVPSAPAMIRARDQIWAISASGRPALGDLLAKLRVAE